MAKVLDPSVREALRETVHELTGGRDDYDPLLDKLVVWGADRAQAIARLRRALDEYTVTGIRTNAPLFRAIVRDAAFLRGEVFTRWLDERLSALLSNVTGVEAGSGPEALGVDLRDAALVAAALHHQHTAAAQQAGATLGPAPGTAPRALSGEQAAPESHWKLQARLDQTGRNDSR